MFCKDWAYSQYFGTLLSQSQPETIFRIAGTLQSAINIAANGCFTSVILDMEQASENMQQLANQMESSALSAKVCILAQREAESIPGQIAGHETIKRPCRRDEIQKFIESYL